MKYLLILLIVLPFYTLNANTLMENTDLYPYLVNDKYVYVDSTNTIVLPTPYAFAYPFDGEFAIVEQNGKEGIINRKGEWVIKPQYTGVKIARVGQTQLFITVKAKKENYKIYKWRILPNLSLFSGYKAPLVGTTTAHTEWAIYDKAGNRLWTDKRNAQHDDYNNRTCYYLNEVPFKYFAQNNQIFLYKDLKFVRAYSVEGNKLVKKEILRNMCGLIKTGYLSEEKNKTASLRDFDNNIIDKNYILNRSISKSRAFDVDASLNRTIWEHKGKYVCISNTDNDFVPISASVMKKDYSLLMPLDSVGDSFWVTSSAGTGVIDKNGEWLLTDDNIFLDKIYGDGTVVFRRKNPVRYFIYQKGVTYNFPEEVCPGDRITGLVWISRLRTEDDKNKHGVYDLTKQQWYIKPGDYISEINVNHYSREKKIYPKDRDTYILAYSVLDINNNETTTGDYRQLRTTIDKNLVLVTNRYSSEKFYVKVQTGEELRRIE